VFRNVARLEYREGALNSLRIGQATDVRHAEAESEARRQRVEAERALDSALADSFPASDPPSWTLGVSHSPDGRRD
jgi:hypothetical protein